MDARTRRLLGASATDWGCGAARAVLGSRGLALRPGVRPEFGGAWNYDVNISQRASLDGDLQIDLLVATTSYLYDTSSSHWPCPISRNA